MTTEEDGYRNIAAAMLHQAVKDCMFNKHLDAILFLLTGAERYFTDLDMNYENVFQQVRKWYVKIELSEAGGTVSSTFLKQLGLPFSGAEKNASVKTVAPCIKAAIRKAIESHLTDEA